MMHFWKAGLALVAVGLILAMSACGTMANGNSTMASTQITISSTAVGGAPETGFDSGLVSVGRIDKAFAAVAGGAPNTRSLPFSWKNLPAGTKALAVVLDDPDARLVLASFGMKELSFLHWIATDIDPTLGGLADNAAASASFPQGKNGTGMPGYLAPQPPADIPKNAGKKLIHIYRLKLIALSAPTGLKAGFSLAELEAAVKDKTLGSTTYNFSYSND